jgi:hypothetical protein
MHKDHSETNQNVVGRATLKMLLRKSKTQFVKQERNMQNAIVLLNYLKPIAPQKLMLRKQVFTKNFQGKRTQPATLLNNKYLSLVSSYLCTIQDSNLGLQNFKHLTNNYAIRTVLN